MRKFQTIFGILLALAILLAYAVPETSPETEAAAAAITTAAGAKQPASGALNENDDNDNGPRYAFFGDLHVHTKVSLDSFILSNPNGPREAYGFAMGQEVNLPGGQSQQLSQPLDFIAVTDHAEFFGEIAVCNDPQHAQYNSQYCQDVRGSLTDPDLRDDVFDDIVSKLVNPNPVRNPICGEDGTTCLEAVPGVWQDVQQVAHEFYDPGEFTTFVAYEYTSSPNNSNLHRNVIFRDTQAPDTPWSYFEAPTAEELWGLLDQTCTGDCDFLAIPHNPNMSQGDMFRATNTDGSPLTAGQAARRVKIEPLVEIMQTKGESECHPALGNDELCAFEMLGPLNITPCDENGQPDNCVWASNYVRNALKEGLLVEEEIGVNPFKLGFIGGTDTHNGTPGATEENTYKGHHGTWDNDPSSRLTGTGGGSAKTPNLFNNPGGLAGVWAEENSRDAIFDALRRRETFATSGTRIRVRFFGGWDFYPDLPKSFDVVEQAYEQGVPMGGNLPLDLGNKSPSFMVLALKDPLSANLERIQIIKGWVENDQAHEQVYDVACSDGLTPDPQSGRCPDNGASVNLENCEVSQTGDSTLYTVWTDPDFDPSQRAFYYARVLENPTCRWSTYDALALSVSPPAQPPPTLQERAWTSPIWYTPWTVYLPLVLKN